MFRLTAYEALERIASIADPVARKQALENEFANNNPLAIAVQRIYHPNYTFDIDINECKYKPSNHDSPGPFYTSIRRWDRFRPGSESFESQFTTKELKTKQFVDLLESVSTGDSLLLLAIINKKLPWDALDEQFIVEVFPQLFPATFRKQENSESNSAKDNPSKKQQCRDIFANNPTIARKAMLELFEAVGVTKTTASLYYTDFNKGTK